MTVEHAVHRLTAEVAEWFGLPAGTLREGALLRRPVPHGEPQRQGDRRDRCQRRSRVPRGRVPRRLIELGVRRVAEIPADKPSLEEALTILRDVTADPTNTVLYELAVAARTDAKLRQTLRDVMALYIAQIHETVRPLLPEEFESASNRNFLAMSGWCSALADIAFGRTRVRDVTTCSSRSP